MVKLRRVESQHKINEMAQPRHKKVVLTILISRRPKIPLEISFISRKTTQNGTTHHYIEMSDYSPQRADQIRQKIDVPDNTNARVAKDTEAKEEADIVDFATKIADKYGKSSRSKNLIKKSIVNCYNQAVVDHDSPSELKLQMINTG